jgi:transcriptional regulator with XRE-family HTH domain
MYVRLRNVRTDAGLTQAELAAKVGTTQSYISSIERGAKTPSFPMIERLAAALNVAPLSIIALGNDSRRVVISSPPSRGDYAKQSAA